MLDTELKYKKILIKLSGEILKSGDKVICPKVLFNLISSIKNVIAQGAQVALVIGGGNILRGVEASEQGIHRTTGDYMGMLATCINALALKDIFHSNNIPSRVLSAIAMSQVAEPYILGRALSHLSKGRIVIFSAGTGNPYFSTDTAAALRANEINADLVVKATKVDGLYDKDPQKYSDAVRISRLSHQEVLDARYEVMDRTAFTLCAENNKPIAIFDVKQAKVLEQVLRKDCTNCSIIG